MLESLRRHIMMQQKSGSLEYIQDGLIFWLDGIEKGTDNGWLDLIGGVLLSGGLPRTDKGFMLTTGSSASLLNANALLNFDENATFEIARNVSVGGHMIAIIGSSSTYNVNLSDFVEGYGIAGSSSSFYKGRFAGVGKTISINKERCLSDFNAPPKYTEDYWTTWTPSGIQINPGPYARCATCELFSVRVYNRLLTAEEIIHNQQIDNLRFNLGL